MSISQSDTITYSKIGFDNDKYLKLQKEAILERMKRFSGGRLYFEIGGKLLFDAHASRVLPGFDPENKKHILKAFKDQAEIVFCVSYGDILNNRQLSNEDIDYSDAVFDLAQKLEKELEMPLHFVINKCKRRMDEKVQQFADKIKTKYPVYFRYLIPGYPTQIQHILSKKGYGADDYIPLTKPLAIVTGAASGSGKMSTCMGQMYLDDRQGLDSGYAKYETFPIWNIPLHHPVNLAYEAATADIGDYNQMDPYHKQAYGIDSVNYNRDVEAFDILMSLIQRFASLENPMRDYRSPTDMGISQAGFCITDEKIVAKACLEEIERRKKWYQEIIDRGEGDEKWVERCENLMTKFQAPNSK